MTERLPDWGAVRLSDGRARFRLWAPDHAALTLRLHGSDIPMESAGGGWFEGVVEAPEGARYEFVLPDGRAVPDPASRRQEWDVHGPSVLSGADHDWRTDWRGRPWEEAVICEVHIGTFTPEGTFRTATRKLDALAETGFTAIELMPVAQFAGDRGWGYDGVLPYAPHPVYGTPADLRTLVDAAHARGLMVLLDVVYNHFGPEGNYLHAYAGPFFDASRHTPWGAGIDYAKAPVRRFFIENALCWLRDFRLDGLRLDAVDQIRDASEPDLLTELAAEVRAAVRDRPVHLTTEDNRNLAGHLVRHDGEPALYTAEWNDDFHNAAHVVATGETEGYYRDLAGDPAGHLARALAEGFAFQDQGRGEPSAHLPPAAFVDFLQNHDQIGNRAQGERLVTLTDAATHDALVAILLLSPHIPLMFMGEDWSETRPFLFFAGFGGDLARAVTEGRRREFADFAAFAGHTGDVPDPIDPSSFEASRIDWEARESPQGLSARAKVAHLLHLRREWIVPRLARAGGHCGRILAAEPERIAVDWRLDDMHLSLRARLRPGTAPLPPARGTLIHRRGEAVDAPFAAHHVEMAP